MRRPGRAGYQPRLDQARLRSGNHAARCALMAKRTAAISFGCSRYRVPCRQSSDRRLRRGGQRAAAADVLPAGRRRHQGRQQARRNHMEPHLRGGRRPARRHRPRESIALPAEETERRWKNHPPRNGRDARRDVWRFRDQMMAKHKGHHIQVAYAPDAAGANRALAAKAAMFREMGIPGERLPAPRARTGEA